MNKKRQKLEQNQNVDLDFNDLTKVLKAWYEEDGKKLPEPPNPETHPSEWKKFWI